METSDFLASEGPFSTFQSSCDFSTRHTMTFLTLTLPPLGVPNPSVLLASQKIESKLFLLFSGSRAFSHSSTTTDCLTILFHSDANYPELAQIPMVKDSSPQDHSQSDCRNQKNWDPQVICTSANPAGYKFMYFLNFPLSVDNSLEQLTKLRSALY